MFLYANDIFPFWAELGGFHEKEGANPAHEHVDVKQGIFLVIISSRSCSFLL
ncbi:hypothetical protein HMPREF1153_2231 [Selenomonas sp. CM52]|nr:hypothetical protein HMPREF1153_2231 [Selenomonas sp. CM52]